MPHSMNRTLRLGRVLGVELVIDRTWLLTFVLATWTLGTLGERLLPPLHPAALTLLSAAAAIGVFASLALHEAAHGLTLRAFGLPVHRSTAFLLGGVTDVECAPSSPHVEVVAAFGALATNALLGLILRALSVPLHGIPAVFVSGLATANLTIAAVNLLPAFPLDGGRIVRAAFWRGTNDVERATRWSAWIGQLVGWTTVLGGVVLAFSGRGLWMAAGMWIAFFGWFLTSAAARAYGEVVMQEALAGVTVSRLMRRTLCAVPSHVSVAVAVRGWLERPSDVVAVIDGERVVGTISMQDVRALPAVAWERTAVSELAARDPQAVVDPLEDASNVLRKMRESDVERLPVVEGAHLAGVIERADIERWITAHEDESAAVAA